jgi:hypothetical protein
MKYCSQIIIASVFILMVGCHSQTELHPSISGNDTIILSINPDSPFVLKGQYLNSKQTGVWIYKDCYGKPIQDVIYNYDKDSNQIKTVQKFLENGKLICEEIFFNDSLISIIYSCGDPDIKSSTQLNVNRYCQGCHETSESFSYKIDSLDHNEVIAFVSNSDSLKKTSLKWATSLYKNYPNIDQVHNFHRLSRSEIKAILDYYSSPEMKLGKRR